MKWLDIRPPANRKRLFVEEQTLPGDDAPPEDEADRKGLPDIVIYNHEGWCLLIESKVQARLTKDQLRRHVATLRRRGFERPITMTLTKAHANMGRVMSVTWSGLYEWLQGGGKGWPERLRDYLRVAEARLANEEYLDEGTLTMFDGFHFGDDSPYAYGEAKRLLRLAMVELRKNKELRKLGMDSVEPGRKAITGRGATSVWDYLPLLDRPRKGLFTSYPHLTLSVHQESLVVAVTIPNGVARDVRERFKALNADGFAELNARIIRNAKGILRSGASVSAYAVQRHYRSQRSQADVDARVEFRLETTLRKQVGRVKRRAEWIELYVSLLQRKKANVQFGYTVDLPWGTKGLDRRESLDLIVESWLAMKPLLDCPRGRPFGSKTRRTT